MSRQGAAFDIRGALPSGVTVLEASAGTGKTYTIAALAARYVAEGTPLEKLLLVTFTRMATGELRERVRHRLVDVERGLEQALAGVTPIDDDEVVDLLAEGSPEEVRARRDRLRRALADFDGATIATTHGFCQEVLGGLGIAGDLEPDVTFAEDLSDLVEEVIDDLYVRRFSRGDGQRPPLDRSHVAEIARAAVANPATPIAPAHGELPQMRRRLALAVRDELELRKRRTATMSYDDLLTRLDKALADEGGAVVAARLRERYAVVLVDEFQDTDPVQWDIVRRAFAETGATLVLIGDPKQAIYAFRGADVYAYLDAAGGPGARPTLDVNWRSDQALIDAYDAMFAGAKLGHEGIVYRRVRAAAANQKPRLFDAPESATLRMRVVHGDEPGVSITGKGYAAKDSARDHIARDVASDLVTLLSSGAEIERRSDDGTPLGRETVRPGHVAVLVARNREASLIRDALDEVGIPAVINGAGSVFGTLPAREWLRLFEALERPAAQTRARSGALTCFFGWSPEQVTEAGEADWEQVHRRLHDWARLLRHKGVATLMETITAGERLPERVLAAPDGERRLTDLRHIAQLLHATATTEQMGTTALTAWLRRRIAEADRDKDHEERSRRLESDAEAVQVLTIHRSKGLEFPIVYLPFLWDPGWVPPGARPVSFHDPEAGDVRTLDVGLEGDDYESHQHQNLVEERGEDLRLAYVALTRARHQAVLWWAGSEDSRHSPLSRLLFFRDEDGNVAPAGTRAIADAEVAGRFEELSAEAPGCVAVERSSPGPPTRWAGPATEHAELTAAVFDRELDRRWRRTSYSDITAGTHEPRVTSEPEEDVVSDEPDAGESPPGTDEGERDPALAVPSLLGETASGVRFGTLVHHMLERTDFAASDLDAELERELSAALDRGRIEIGDPVALVTGLRAAIETPLGSLLDDTRLRDVQRADRRDELEFELPLAGGDEPSGRFALAAIRDLLRTHLADEDPLSGYAERLDDPALRQVLRGYLTGSLDSVLRVTSDGGVPRFAIVDYKTNWLGVPGEELTAWHHRPVALAAEMRRAHYGLQALLYSVALHRFLRWRLPGYDAERNFAGVLYLFLRGMTGPDTPRVDGTPCGVLAWRPAKALVEGLSDVLDGKVAA